MMRLFALVTITMCLVGQAQGWVQPQSAAKHLTTSSRPLPISTKVQRKNTPSSVVLNASKGPLDIARSAGDDIKDRTNEVKDYASDKAKHVSNSARSAREDAKSRARSAKSGVKDVLEDGTQVASGAKNDLKRVTNSARDGAADALDGLSTKVSTEDRDLRPLKRAVKWTGVILGSVLVLRNPMSKVSAIGATILGAAAYSVAKTKNT